MGPTLFQACVGDIERAYSDLGHTLGWRFLMGPRATLSPATRYAFITLNPGGDFEPSEHPRASREDGSAYMVESWPGFGPGEAPLQRQIRGLAEIWRQQVDYPGGLAEFLRDGVLAAYFLPFRSPRLEQLPHRRESLAFASRLWARVLTDLLPAQIVTIDREAFAGLGAVLTNSLNARLTHQDELPTGWGRYSASVARYTVPGRPHSVTIGRLPHLSTFKLLSRPVCRPHLERFLDAVCSSK